jgi:hypothetical protein
MDMMEDEMPAGGMMSRSGEQPRGGEPMPGQEPMPEEEPGATSQASPEEQAQYDQFVGRAMEIIYKPEMFPRVVEMLRGGGNEGEDPEQTGQSGPAQGLANATAMIVTRVFKAAMEAGAELSPDVLFHGGSELFMQLAEISDAAGISDYANDRDKLEAAYFLAIDLTTQQLRADGLIEEQEAKAAMQQLQEMDANGQLEPIFRELDAQDQAAMGGDDESVPPENVEEAEMMGGGMAPREMQ